MLRESNCRHMSEIFLSIIKRYFFIINDLNVQNIYKILQNIAKFHMIVMIDVYINIIDGHM